MSSTDEVNRLQIPLEELSDATNGFSIQNLLGRGGFGKVYKGVSVKHGNIAIKMLDPQFGQGVQEFRTEISLLSVYKHQNIVSLLGFCDQNGQKILVYKYESNGSLDRKLGMPDLTWIQRLQICLDAARGLWYLHDDVEPHRRILHRDVKSSNILLDENWRAKISDFGLSRVGPANIESTFLFSKPCGTFEYIDPEYRSSGYLTQKSDVYSFGIVLFEVLCGRLSYVAEYQDERQYLTNLIRIHWGKKTLDEIVYSNLQSQIKRASLLTFTSIAYQCLQSGNERPTMKKVVEQLEKALDDQLALSGWWWDDDDFADHHQGQLGLLQASSSSQSRAKLWTHDVFISFRRNDTSYKDFVPHLYHDLTNQLISTHRDDETLIKDIQESRIAIIVFSKNYASSSRHLDELAFIMKNSEERGQIVIPVFYDVDPSDVRKQTGSYGEAFAMHELDNNNKVESWREALVKAVNVPGWDNQWDMAGNGQDEKYIQRLVRRILYILRRLMHRSQPNSGISSAGMYLVGKDTRMQELKSRLEEVGPGGVHMVGICGMWGSGKSTVASSIFYEIRHEFEGSCFFENVRDQSRMYGLKTIQQEIFSKLLKTKVNLSSTEQGLSTITRRLSQKSVLLVLDDVDHIDHLKMLAGSKNWFGNGSRIIFTTRNQDLVKAHDGISYNVRMLDDIEAIELFSRHAFGKGKPVKAGFQEVSLNIVSKFGGHPLSLMNIGLFLQGKSMSEWTSILDILEGMQVDEILKRVKVRDDGIVKDSLSPFHTLLAPQKDFIPTSECQIM